MPGTKSGTKQTQKVVREILPKRLKLVVREWTNQNGVHTKKYRARIYSPAKEKYNYFTLNAETEPSAIDEALDLYTSMADDIKNKLPIGGDAKKIDFYIEMFMEHMEIRAKNGKITPKRVVIVRQLLRSLEKFALEHRNPTITKLPQLYQQEFESWRDKSLTRLTKRPLTARSRNNEVNCHKQFFGFLKDRDIVSLVPRMNYMKVNADVIPFPDEKYNALLSVSRREIENCRHSKTQWNWMCVRHIIMLMNGTGCRVAEVRNLRWSDLTDRGGEKRIHFHGKAKQRDVVVSDRVWNSLDELREYKRVKGHYWKWNEDDYPYVFASWKLPHIKSQFDNWGRRRWYEEIGLDPMKYQLGCFRHKFISNALKQGVHALQIANYCGTSQHMIALTYGRFTPKGLFDQVFEGSPIEALQSKGRSQWFENLLERETQKEEDKKYNYKKVE